MVLVQMQRLTCRIMFCKSPDTDSVEPHVTVCSGAAVTTTVVSGEQAVDIWIWKVTSQTALLRLLNKHELAEQSYISLTESDRTLYVSKITLDHIGILPSLWTRNLASLS